MALCPKCCKPLDKLKLMPVPTEYKGKRYTPFVVVSCPACDTAINAYPKPLIM
jgi:RNase P subunit RPR2